MENGLRDGLPVHRKRPKPQFREDLMEKGGEEGQEGP